MAVSPVTSARNVMIDALVDLVDVGAGANGSFVIYNAGGAVLASLDFQNPAFGDAAAGSASALGTPLTADAGATGEAATFAVLDADGATVWTGTVGISGSGADAIIDTTAISAGDGVQVNGYSITHPA
jgi:hypothetical protein